MYMETIKLRNLYWKLLSHISKLHTAVGGVPGPEVLVVRGRHAHGPIMMPRHLVRPGHVVNGLMHVVLRTLRV